MGETAVKVAGLSKRYQIGIHEKYPTIREAMMCAVSGSLRKIRSWSSHQGQDSRPGLIWALKDVDMEVNHGEVFGIIGPNGAGKSTLLRVLSGITEPTTGYADIYGRIGSLLEVGTGFHMELTGRENIFMNGAILGMTRNDIKRKFDEIVAFSDVEKFLDTQVKRYSSGMYLRLAFAVAAHLETEILLVDEVLAVGDAAFQRKCLAKMGDVTKSEGRTILFVSHNMEAMQSLCKRALCIDSGKLVDQGLTTRVVENYLNSIYFEKEIPLDQIRDRSGDGNVRVTSFKIESANSDKAIYSDSRLKITIGYRSENQVRYPHFVVKICDDKSGQGVFRFSSDVGGGFPESLAPEGEVTCITDPINLTPGRCFADLTIKTGAGRADYVPQAKFFNVRYKDVDGSNKCPKRKWVLTMIRHRWFTDGDA